MELLTTTTTTTNSPNSMETVDAILKFAVIGEEGIGKTTFVSKYCEQTHGWQKMILNSQQKPIDQSNQHNNTNGFFTVRSKIEIVDMKSVKIEIWDAMNISPTKDFLSGTKGVFLCFDLTNPRSFDSLPNWLRHIEEYAFEAGIVLCGFKSDLVNQRSVTQESIDRFAKDNNFQYFETSAKFNRKVEESFDEVLKQAMLEFDDLRPNYVPTIEVLGKKIESFDRILLDMKKTNDINKKHGNQQQSDWWNYYYSSRCNVM